MSERTKLPDAKWRKPTEDELKRFVPTELGYIDPLAPNEMLGDLPFILVDRSEST